MEHVDRAVNVGAVFGPVGIGCSIMRLERRPLRAFRFTGVGGLRGSVVPDGTKARRKRMGNQPDAGGLCYEQKLNRDCCILRNTSVKVIGTAG